MKRINKDFRNSVFMFIVVNNSNYLSISNLNSYLEDSILLPIIFMILSIVFLVLMIIIKEKEREREAKKSKEEQYKHTIGNSDIEIQSYLPGMTEEQLLKGLYKRYIEIENAYTNFDYDNLKQMCIDDLYNSFKIDLDDLKSNNEKNVKSDFNCIEYNINGISEENNIIIIRMFVRVSFFDYIIDTKTNIIKKGDNSNKVTNQYLLNFIVKKDNSKAVCPSCGSSVEKGQSKCNYCNTIIKNNYNDFVLSSKRKI